MELTKNIFFNTDKLLQNSKVKISYVGRLFEENSNDVYIHFGFGNSWDNLSDMKMEKTELGFQAEIELLENDTFNFCFRNENDSWDNNEGQNYVFDLERMPLELMTIDDLNELSKNNRLRKTYLWSKKIRLAVYKIITYLPKLISGNYRRKIKGEE